MISAHNLVNRLKDSVDRPITLSTRLQNDSLPCQSHPGLRSLSIARGHFVRLKAVQFGGIQIGKDHVFDYDSKVFIIDPLFLVGNRKELIVNRLKFLFLEIIAHLRDLVSKGMSARSCRKDHGMFGDAQLLGAYNFVRGTVFEDSILVYAGRMGKGICPYNSLVGLNWHPH